MDITWEEFVKLSKEVRENQDSRVQYAEANYEEIMRSVEASRKHATNDKEHEVVDEVLYMNGYIYDLVLNENKFDTKFANEYQAVLSSIEVNERLLVDLNRALARITFNIDVLELLDV